MQSPRLICTLALSILATTVPAFADNLVTIKGDPNAPTTNFSTPGNTATSGYTIQVSGNGRSVIVTLATMDLSAPDFANLYFESLATDTAVGSNVGFEASSTAVNDAFDPNTGQKYATGAGFSSVETIGANSKSITVTIPDSFFLNDPDMIGFEKPTSGQSVSLHLSQSFGYSVVGGSAYYPRPNELGLAEVDAVSATPEPSSLALLGTGVLGLIGAARRRFV